MTLPWGVPALAEAKAKRISTRVALTEATVEGIAGEVRSADARCLGDRPIRLGEPDAGAPATVARSDVDGRFRIEASDLPASGASLEVTVGRKALKGNRVCTVATTPLQVDAGALSGGAFGDSFRGTLSSSIEACVPGRRIEVFEVSAEPVFVGSNLTDSAGVWVLVAAGGDYEARAVPILLSATEGYVLCGPRVSPRWFYEEPF